MYIYNIYSVSKISTLYLQYLRCIYNTYDLSTFLQYLQFIYNIYIILKVKFTMTVLYLWLGTPFLLGALLLRCDTPEPVKTFGLGHSGAFIGGAEVSNQGSNLTLEMVATYRRYKVW